MDGYDELKPDFQGMNLYDSNDLENFADKNSK